MNTQNLKTLSAHELAAANGGNPIVVAVLFATYTFVGPLLALGVAVGVQEAMEAQE